MERTEELMKVEVTAQETVKPSSPTPQHLRILKLSLLDQLSPPYYTPLVLFYEYSTIGNSSGEEDNKETAGKRSKYLKESLCVVLTRFYPLAGRIKDNVSIECNDKGAEFLEARVNCTLFDVLEKPKIELMKHFIPGKSADWRLGPLLLVQVSFFVCGGMALGLSFSHKIVDAATFSVFMKGWANTALGFPDSVTPGITMAPLLPPADHFPIMPLTFNHVRLNGVAKRFVFCASKLEALRAIASSLIVQQPTRVEAVSALIWRCAINSSRSRLGSSSRPSVLAWAVNMRSRLVPPLREYSFGNIFAKMLMYIDDGSEVNLSGLVCRLRKGMTEFRGKYVKKLQDNNERLTIVQDLLMEVRTLQIKANDIDMYTHTSWCRFPLYEADFGWGKPIWTSIGSMGVPNTVVLMDTKDGDGIEAWVCLIQEHMALFELDKELLAFASLNPSAC